MTFRPILSVLTLLLCLTTWQPCIGDESQLSAEAAVRKLGANSFLERENASQQLILMGTQAESALVAAENGSDREIQDRARQVLRLIREKSRADLLAAFQKTKSPDVDANQTVAKNLPDKNLPGWSEFVERFGDSAASREIYATILRAEWDLIADCVSTDDFQRRNRLMKHSHDNSRRGVYSYNSEAGTALALFFVYAQYPESPGPKLHQTLFQYMGNPHVKEKLTSGSQNKAARDLVRELVGDWVIAVSEPELNVRNAPLLALQQARIYGLVKPSRVIAQRVLENKDSLPVIKRNAIESIVLRDDRSQVGLIEPYLDDKTVLSTSKLRIVQLRDVALASVMHLKGHDLNAIGAKLRPPSSTRNAFEPQSIGFITEGDRKKAFETFRKLEEKKAERQ